MSPLEYWRAVTSAQCEQCIRDVREARPDLWDQHEKRYARGETHMDTETFMRMGWAVRVVFKMQFEDALVRARAYGASSESAVRISRNSQSCRL